MSYDTKCFKLAAEFLDDHPAIRNIENVGKLAQHIQTSIEDWIDSAKGKPCKHCGCPYPNDHTLDCPTLKGGGQ